MLDESTDAESTDTEGRVYFLSWQKWDPHHSHIYLFILRKTSILASVSCAQYRMTKWLRSLHINLGFCECSGKFNGKSSLHLQPKLVPSVPLLPSDSWGANQMLETQNTMRPGFLGIIASWPYKALTLASCFLWGLLLKSLTVWTHQALHIFFSIRVKLEMKPLKSYWF